MLKTSRRMIFLVLAGICLTCGCGSGTSATYPVVVFSDVHFNPFYDKSLFPALVASDASEWASIFATSSVTEPSAWTTDTNYPLLVLALSSIKQNLGASPLVIYTGDVLGHNFPQTFFTLYGSQDVAAMKAFTDKTVAFFLEEVRSYVGNIPVMFVLGNSDSYTGDGPDSDYLSNTAELYYANFVSGAVDHQTFLDTYTSGGYYSAEPLGTSMMVIGLNTFALSTLVIGNNDSEVQAELSWLDSSLASAKAAHKKAWLLMHVPLGAYLAETANQLDSSGHLTTATMMLKPDYQTSLLQILSKYPGIITLMLAGHTHMDEFRDISVGTSSSDGALEITPGITPYFGNNPAYKVFTFLSGTYEPADYSSLNYDLATMPGQFNSYYTFSTVYSMQDLLDAALAGLFPMLAADDAKQTLYRGYYYSGNNSANPITDANWPVFWCGIGKMAEQELVDCVNSY
ncbi:MAG: metallophosphoesterase [Candidatus Peribacteraceae bacterium]